VKPRALVTGGGRGIGAAIAKELTALGHPVIINFRANEASARALADDISRAGGDVELAQFDVRDKAAVDAAIATLQRHECPIGVVVNNAGITADAPYPTLSERAWHDVISTTLDGFHNVTRPLIMGMVSRRWGRIINIASVSGIRGNRGQANYAAAKAGLIGATRAIALEVAKRGVTVNAVAPGFVDTDMTADMPRDRVVEHIPMRRIGRAEEVAKLVRFLASEDAGYITGQVVAVDGGLSA
jgi:3-oxoacyl-[acyl-carrier protein] reductase